MTGDEHAGGTGKWGMAGVPHKGWTCVDMDDLEEPSAICEMCEKKEIRYVHYMEHPDYDEVLACGCICAGHMEQDYEGAASREKKLRNASARRKKWLTRKWRISSNGNPFINVQGFNIVVFPAASNTFKFRIVRGESEAVFSPRRFETESAAKLAAFDKFVSFVET